MSGKWIVVFKDGVTSDQISNFIEELKVNGGVVKNRWDTPDGTGILNGFAATIPNAFLESFKSLQADKIAYIEPDGVVTIQ